MTALYTVTSALVVALSLYGLLAGADLIRRLMAANVMASGVFLYLVVLSAETGEAARDPVPQAMVLTGIVIAVSITAFGLGLVRLLEAQDEAPQDGRRGKVERQKSAHE